MAKNGTGGGYVWIRGRLGVEAFAPNSAVVGESAFAQLAQWGESANARLALWGRGRTRYKEPCCDEQVFETLCTASGELNTKMLEVARSAGDKIPCYIYFGAKEWNDKCCNRVNIKLPDTYRAKPAQPAQPFQNMEGIGTYPDLGTFLVMRNPFAIKGGDGKYIMFADYCDIYTYTLQKIRQLCPMGYIDLPVIVQALTKWDKAECMKINDIAMSNFPTFRNECILVDWKNLDNHRDMFKELIISLHQISSTQYDALEFDIAWDKFLIYNTSLP